MRNIKLEISYLGSNYKGWQKQPNYLGIQGNLEYAIKQITGETVKLNGSGRTDSGVHAMAQVANFYTENEIQADLIPKALNSKLPKDISVINAKEVSLEFHSRYSVHKKKYKYQLYLGRRRSPFLAPMSYHLKCDIDIEKMKTESEKLIGKHDFISFMKKGSSIKTTVREIYTIDWKQEGELLILEIEGNGFLYNMVRIIIGTLVDIGRGKINRDISEIIEAKDRGYAGHTAPAQGLFLMKVDY